MMDYSRYIQLYEQQEGHLNCIEYITIFFNFASSCNTPIQELNALHEKWLHQIGRNYSKNYRRNCRRECRRFIKFLEQKKEDGEEKRKIKPKTTIHESIKEMNR